MKRVLKRVGIGLMVLLTEINLFFFGRSLLDKPYNTDFRLNHYQDVVHILLDADLYQSDNLQLWFMAAFALFIFVYVNLYISQSLESPKYRSLKLYRYGKDRYLMQMKKKVFIGNVCAILLLLLGLAVIGLILALQKVHLYFNWEQGAAVSLQFLKFFLVMELYGSLNIYYLLRNESHYVLVFSLMFLFLQLLLETFGGVFHLFTMAGTVQNMFYVIGLVIINLAADFFCRMSAKRKSMC